MRLGGKTTGYLFVGFSGTLWGTGFLYIQYILDQGLPARDLVSWKMMIGFCILLSYTACKDRNLLKIDRKGLLYFAFLALVCHCLYNLSINMALERTNIATTVSLMYTAPVFVLLIARFTLKEPLTIIKVIAVFLCVAGVFLTATGGTLSVLDLNISGVLFGLFTGLCYAIMNLVSKVLLKTYQQLTLLTYTFGMAFLFSLSFSNPLAAFRIEFNLWFWVNILLLGAVPTAAAYFLFTTGLSYNIESSKAAVVATVEVPVSVIGSYIVFGQDIWGWKLAGITLVLISVMILQEVLIPPKQTAGETSCNEAALPHAGGD